MRLINTHTGRFKEFFDSQRPPYAILSHTWGEDEISYLDLLFLTSDLPATALGAVHMLLRNPSRETQGFRKIEACCKVARERGFEWVWIDSCCIDKSSSAELSEAINSMWQWYRDAVECYAFLSDVSAAPGDIGRSEVLVDVLKNVRWFTRGWTLQELLAPKRVIFYNKQWEAFASKDQIAKELSIVTKIPLAFLAGQYDPSDCKICSAAMKMSWLSRRETTRVEDMAYCMLGLFDVHMPLIYGEGRKAFMRLQLEIIKKTDDDSIYAWTSPTDSSGLLAIWPTAFTNSGNIVQINFPEDSTPWLPPSMTSIGLEMRGRYQREDQHQQGIDRRHGVQSISTALPVARMSGMVMHCGPYKVGVEAPVTQFWTRRDRGRALSIALSRVGATWRRVNCRRLDFVDYGMYEPSEFDAYALYYIRQEGM